MPSFFPSKNPHNQKNIAMWVGTLALTLSVGACGGGSHSHSTSDEINNKDVVITKYGKIQGITADSKTSFKGIPFAQPPIGPLRWVPPQEPKPWENVLKADTFGNDCMQLRPLHARSTGMSENCLYLNVYKPSSAKPGDKLPVHVWIYGGAFANGSASDPRFDNPPDVDAGIIYVNFNYRVNAFGFIAHPGLTAESPNKASGNYGLMDQIAALKWVRDNIEQFGGDPGMVTISGESAGAASIGYLIQSPLSTGLFKRAILESTFGFHPQRTLAQQEELMTQTFGGDIQELRKKSAADILKILPGNGIETTGGIFGFQDWAPIVDGNVLRQSDRQAWKDGNFQKIDMMIGDNENEGATFLAIGGLQALPTDKRKPEEFRNFLREQYGDLADKALAIYPADNDNEVLWQLAMAYGDSWFQYSSREMSRLMMKHKPNVYRYVFSKHAAQPRMLGDRPAAGHTDEIPYIFGSVKAGDKYSTSDVATSLAFVDAKQRFIKTGNPNGGKLGATWPQYDATDPYLEFGDNGQKAGSGYRNNAYDLVTEYLNKNIPLK